jgi:DinB family protein
MSDAPLATTGPLDSSDRLDHRKDSGGSGALHPVPGEADAIVPDGKDWTWVLDRPCPECGFVAAEVGADQIAGMVLGFTAPWADVLERPDVRDRPSPQVWSVLEYACHVRDVCRVFETRVELMLRDDEPAFDNWDQDQAARDGRYERQDPAAVAGEILASADRLARAFLRVRAGDWDRSGIRSNGSRFTVLTLGRYLVHDLRHHLHDVETPPA